VILGDLLFPRMFVPLAPLVALFTTVAILSDAILKTSALEPLFFCYALSGLYVLSMIFEAAWLVRGERQDHEEGSFDDE
jgi:hypothetical protein